jgi:hypothetical protein
VPIIYQDRVQGAPRSVFDIPSSNREVLTEQFAQAFEENPIAAARRLAELSEDGRTGPRLDSATARARLKDAGMESDIQVGDYGITENALTTLMERKRIEKRRQEVFGLAEGGIVQGAARLGLSALTSLTDPISAGLNFVPLFGQARYARLLGNAGGALGRAGVRAGVGAAEGAAGAALVEPLVYAMRTQEQADYDAVDSLLNVTLGGFVGAGLHTTVGSLGDLYRGARGETPDYERFRGLSQDDTQLVMNLQRELGRGMDAQTAQRAVETWSPAARRAAEDLLPTVRDIAPAGSAADRVASMNFNDRARALRLAVTQAVEGRPIEVAAAVDARATAAAPEVVGFTTARGSTYEVGENGVTTRDKAARTDLDHEGQSGPQPTSEATFYVRPDDAVKLGEFQAQGGPRAVIEALTDGRVGVKYIDGKDAGKFERRTIVPASKTPAVGMTPVELWNGGAKAHFGNQITAVRTKPQPATSTRHTSAPDPDYRNATAAADAILAKPLKEAADDLPQTTSELADLAEAEAKQLADRLGVKFEDADMADVAEGAVKAERWARAAELATVCLTRGG